MDEEAIFEQARILLETKLDELKVRGFTRLKMLATSKESEEVRFGTVILTFTSWAKLNPDNSLSVLTEARKARLFRRSRVAAMGFYITQNLDTRQMKDPDLTAHGYKAGH